MCKAKLHVSAALEIPTYWTPEQALAVYELVDTLRDKIWLTYSSDIQKEIQKELSDVTLPLYDQGPCSGEQEF